MQYTKTLTDEFMMELYQHGSEKFPFKYYYEDVHKFDNHRVDWHWHREFELLSVTEGTILCSIGNKKISLSAGQGIFINSGVIHKFEAQYSSIMPNILFSPEFVAPKNSCIYEKFVYPFLVSDISYIIIKGDAFWQKDILEDLSKIYLICSDEESTWEMDVHSLVSKVWSELFKHKKEFMTMENRGIKSLTQSRLRQMMDYIDQNYAKKITLYDIAMSARISKSEALRCFSNGMQTSAIDYLNKYRLDQARKLLVNTNLKITAIVDTVGFDSVSYFDRIFKREFGVTPKNFRLSMQK